MLVTTSYSPSLDTEARAKRLAAEFDCTYVPRGGQSVRKLLQRYRESQLLLLTERELQLYGDGEAPLFFHPSLSYVRYKRLMNGESDKLLDLSGAEPGDRVLDCTAGLGSDAIVFSLAVGVEGEVTALESELPLFMLLREGLAAYETASPDFNDAMRRVRIKRGNHLEELRAAPDGSVDIVYFDPMFRRPVEESSAISPLRRLANHEPLCSEAVKEAVRVARKCVILKEGRESGEFERLGFPNTINAGNKIAYGVIRL